MLIVISPAKKLDMTPLDSGFSTQNPELLSHSQDLMAILRDKDAFDIAELMKLSMPLADLNSQRFQDWHTPFHAGNAKQALWTFQGDVYQSLDAASFSSDDVHFAQQHLRILSGLYGLLRPLDWMQAYRLEMGTRLENSRGKDLYTFWGDMISASIQDALAQQGDDVLINLASQEYFKAIRSKVLQAYIITPSFKEWKNGQYKVIGIHAKRARGLMSRFIIQHQLQKPDELKAFNVQGYAWNAELSSPQEMVFTRQ
ncbi:MAG: peroxide stress protein YaaA [Zetaproteobacteria bacterium]|nr:peroxide stress protein YaaA [Zetaproteobacteria bacterium]